ncbi:MAG: thiosulfate oxidation carrier complex protein SoxZ [Methyloligellaceae bacterium]
MAKPRVKVPKTAKAGDIIQIKTLVTHKMDTGLQKDKKTGELIPQNIIDSFVATYNGEVVFSARPHAAISANPYIAFKIKVDKTGDLEMVWKDDKGKSWTAKKTITVN